MFRNYFLTAWRNLTRNRVYSTLNIAGLASGMAVALLIGLWAFHEFSYDRFLPGYQQLYVTQINFTSQHDGIHTQKSMSLPVADALRKDIQGVRQVCETDNIGNQERGLVVGEKKLFLKGGAAGTSFFDMFRFPMQSGDPATALKEPNSIVIDQSTAKALFGDQDPMGRLIRLDNTADMKVTGIIRDIPSNSTLQFSYIIPFSYREHNEDWIKQGRTSWTNNSFNVYVELEPGITAAQITPRIRNIVYDHSEPMRPYKPELFLQPMAHWHLFSSFKDGKEAGGFVTYVRMFMIIGILVLLIACINFMNLSTARSEKRAREVGVRKAIGSQRRDLIFQFLAESLMITLLAFFFSLLLVELVLPAFNSMTHNTISIPFNNPVFWAIMLGYVMLTGLLAGSRPAFYLSAFNPVKVLKGAIVVGKRAALPRKILIVGQFSCSIALIISTIIIYQQIEYAKARPTGYNSDRLVMTTMSADLNKNYAALQNDLLGSGQVENIALSNGAVTRVASHFSLADWPGKNAGEQQVNISALFVTNTYFKTTGMQMATGSDFSKDWTRDSMSVILNEAAVRRIGLKDPVGKMISWNGNSTPVMIKGIVKDALMESPFAPIAPAIFVNVPESNVAIYRLNKGVNTQEAMTRISSIFRKYNPAYPFTYQFVDEEYEKKFNLEVLVGKLAGIFAGLAIFISCLGLFGLAAYVAEQRTREIGIRKVLGATVPQIWLLLSRDFVILVGISCLVASPLAFHFLQGWLAGYDYRISIGPMVFIIAAVMALCITLLTISFQAIRAAIANPVKSLHNE